MLASPTRDGCSTGLATAWSRWCCARRNGCSSPSQRTPGRRLLRRAPCCGCCSRWARGRRSGLGWGLTEATGAARRAAATGGVLDGVLQSIQAQLLSSLGALAFDRLAHLLASATVLGDIPTDPARSAQARAELVALGDRLAELDKLQPADARAWLAGVLAVLGPLGRLLDLGLMPGQAGGSVTPWRCCGARLCCWNGWRPGTTTRSGRPPGCSGMSP
jgi:hypothetical protein